MLRFRAARSATGNSRFADKESGLLAARDAQAKAERRGDQPRAAGTHASSTRRLIMPTRDSVPFSRDMADDQGGIPVVHVNAAKWPIRCSRPPVGPTCGAARSRSTRRRAKFEPRCAQAACGEMSVKFYANAKEGEERRRPCCPARAITRTNSSSSAPITTISAAAGRAACARVARDPSRRRRQRLRHDRVLELADNSRTGLRRPLHYLRRFHRRRRRPDRLAEYFVEHPPVPLEKIVVMLNMDMVGRVKNDKSLRRRNGHRRRLPRVLKKAECRLAD